jgi:HNH endonuclease
MPRCVYCLDEKTDEHFRKAEHVLPQSFGTFENNFTSRGTVCDECNQYFGNHLELALARDTFEGHSRSTYGAKDPDEFRPFGRGSRIIIRLREGPFEGAYVYREYSPEAAEVILQPLPQVGFLNAADRYEYFLLDDIPTQQQLSERGFKLKTQRAICGIAVNEETLGAKLAGKGIEFQYHGELVPPEKSQSVLCEVGGTID